MIISIAEICYNVPTKSFILGNSECLKCTPDTSTCIPDKCTTNGQVINIFHQNNNLINPINT